MTPPDRSVFDTVIVEESVSFTFAQLRDAAAGSDELLLGLVDQGVLEPSGGGPEDWAFAGTALGTVRTARRLTNDLALGAEGAALVLELLAEIASLRARLRRAGLD